MQFRKKYYSRNHLREYLIFFGEVQTNIPDYTKDQCDDWSIPIGLMQSRIATLDGFLAQETEQKTEYEGVKTELEATEKEA